MASSSYESGEDASLMSNLSISAHEKHSASVFLINREFEQCVEVCHKALTRLQPTVNGHGVIDKTTHLEEIEEFVVIIVQAYAELDRWQEVLPYITDLYSGIENVSPNILKLCLLLHAKVREFSTCSAIYNIWVRSNEDTTIAENDIEMLVDIYVTRVLVPAGKSSQVASFIESSRLSQSAKDKLILSYSGLVSDLDTSQTSTAESVGAEHHSPQSVVDRTVERAFRLLRVLMQWIWSIKPPLTARTMAALAGLTAVILILCRGFDYSKSSHYLHIANLLGYFLQRQS